MNHRWDGLEDSWRTAWARAADAITCQIRQPILFFGSCPLFTICCTSIPFTQRASPSLCIFDHTGSCFASPNCFSRHNTPPRGIKTGQLSEHGVKRRADQRQNDLYSKAIKWRSTHQTNTFTQHLAHTRHRAETKQFKAVCSSQSIFGREDQGISFKERKVFAQEHIDFYCGEPVSHHGASWDGISTEPSQQLQRR